MTKQRTTQTTAQPTPPPSAPPTIHATTRPSWRPTRHHARPSLYTELTAAEADDYAASYDGWSVFARYYQSRLMAVTAQLDAVPGGDLLDVGCGPGRMLSHLLTTRADRFRLTGLDQSEAMVHVAEGHLAQTPGIDFVVAPAEAMPLPDARFDAVLAMGVLEYTDLEPALREIARVTRPGGLVVVTMLNPFSPWRLFDWGVYAPARRLLGRLEALAGVPAERRHGAARSGIRARTPRTLCRSLRRQGLEPVDVVHYDRTVLVPPVDRLVRRVDRRWWYHPESTIGRGWPARVTGTAYLVAARRWGMHGVSA